MKTVVKRLFGEEFNNLLYMNLITAVLCIPVITAVPALLALMGTLIKIMDDRCHLRRIKEYFAMFKKKFWKGVLFELILAAYTLLIIWCTSLGHQLPVGGTFLRIFALVFGVLAAIISVPVFILLSCTEMPFGQTFWNGVVMALGRFPRALLAFLFSWGFILLAYLFYPISLLLFIVICISVSSVLTLGAIWPTLNTLVLSQYEPEPEPEEEEK